jgi:hypothetical protein
VLTACLLALVEAYLAVVVRAYYSSPVAWGAAEPGEAFLVPGLAVAAPPGLARLALPSSSSHLSGLNRNAYKNVHPVEVQHCTWDNET